MRESQGPFGIHRDYGGISRNYGENRRDHEEVTYTIGDSEGE